MWLDPNSAAVLSSSFAASFPIEPMWPATQVSVISVLDVTSEK